MAILKIIEVKDKGDIENERLVLSVIDDGNTLGYVVMDATFNEDGDFSNKGRHAFKFKRKSVKKDDLVVLYSRKAMGSLEEKRSSGNIFTIHFFFWGRDATIWNKTEDFCTLLYIVDSKKV